MPDGIPEAIPYVPLCYDYYGNEYIHFRNEDNPDLFEAYSAPATGLYNAYGPNSVSGRAASGDADAKTYAVPVPAIVGDAGASSIAFEMERQYTFQFELFGRKPIVITKIRASAYDEIEQDEPLRLTWAGSNIYWDNARQILTFADSDDKSKEDYQGVFFKWGSLVGVSPDGTTWSPQRAYVPDVPDSDGAWSTDDGLTWGNIPYMTANPTSSGTGSSYLTDETNATNIAALKGDICVYLTKTGAAPKGKRWRMPIADEFRTTTMGEYQRIPASGGFTGITGTNDDGTTVISIGYTKVSSNRPYFPVSGERFGGGGLVNVGTVGDYWTSSPSSSGNNSYIIHFIPSGPSPANVGGRMVALPVRCVVE